MLSRIRIIHRSYVAHASQLRDFSNAKKLTFEESQTHKIINENMITFAKSGAQNLFITLPLDKVHHMSIIDEFKKKDLIIPTYVSEKDHLHVHFTWNREYQKEYQKEQTKEKYCNATAFGAGAFSMFMLFLVMAH